MRWEPNSRPRSSAISAIGQDLGRRPRFRGPDQRRCRTAAPQQGISWRSEGRPLAPCTAGRLDHLRHAWHRPRAAARSVTVCAPLAGPSRCIRPVTAQAVPGRGQGRHDVRAVIVSGHSSGPPLSTLLRPRVRLRARPAHRRDGGMRWAARLGRAAAAADRERGQPDPGSRTRRSRDLVRLGNLPAILLVAFAAAFRSRSTRGRVSRA